MKRSEYINSKNKGDVISAR